MPTALNVAAFEPLAEFKQRMDTQIRLIRNAPKAKGAERIYLPGGMEFESRQKALHEGMMLPDHVMLRHQAVASEYGTDLNLLYQ
jgi:LDH2 family malate/lactate/ureidoglycolate dehydrogenase